MVIFAVLTVFWLFLTIGTLLVHCSYSLDRPVTIGTPMVLTVLAIGTVYHSSKNSQKQSKDSQNSKNHNWPIVTCLPRLYQQCTNRQKQPKDSQTAKNDHWCTNRHMSTQSPPNTQSRANAATLRNLYHMCLVSGHSPSPVGRADSICLHGRPCVWLPFAASCCYTLFYLLMMRMPAARLVCQWPSSNFPYFRTPLANFLLSGVKWLGLRG